MPHDRFFTSSPLSPNASECRIDDPGELHHLLNVMKGIRGDEIELIDGKGALAKGTITDI